VELATGLPLRPAVGAEKLGIPSVVITVKGFTVVAKEAAEAAGVVGLRTAAYPGAVGVHLEEIRKNIKEVLFEQIVYGLTKREQLARLSTVRIETPDKSSIREPLRRSMNSLFQMGGAMKPIISTTSEPPGVCIPMF